MRQLGRALGGEPLAICLVEVRVLRGLATEEFRLCFQIGDLIVEGFNYSRVHSILPSTQTPESSAKWASGTHRRSLPDHVGHLREGSLLPAAAQRFVDRDQAGGGVRPAL